MAIAKLNLGNKGKTQRLSMINEKLKAKCESQRASSRAKQEVLTYSSRRARKADD